MIHAAQPGPGFQAHALKQRTQRRKAQRSVQPATATGNRNRQPQPTLSLI